MPWLLGISSAVAWAADDVVIADFEGENFTGWTVTGEAFGHRPTHGSVDGQMAVDGFEGKGLCNSFHHGDASTGTLVSSSFEVGRKYLKFLIGGGGCAGKTCMNLKVQGKVVRTATGPNVKPDGQERLSRQCWDVTDLAGRHGVLEIVDDATGGWGHISVDQITLSDTPPPSPESPFIKEAEAFVESRAAIAVKDPLRPIYHVMPKAQSIGDPNGPVYFNGEYHIFFQDMPFWGTARSGTVWGHAVSRDMIHWEHLPIAVATGSTRYDAAGIWSGCCVINDGVPTIIYSGNDGASVGQQQCLATSSDNLRTWTKEPLNPILPSQPLVEGLDPSGFRDPFAWREGNEWRLLVGSGYTKDKGGTVLLYRSKDLRKWDFLGPLCEGMGGNCFMWECPTFFPLEDKHVLIVSPLFRNSPGLRVPTQFAVGTYRNNRFVPGGWQQVDYGGPKAFYAATTFEDPKKRRILWGLLMTPQGPAAGWSNCLSLPRLVTLGKDSQVNFAPLPELAALRTRGRDPGTPSLRQGEEVMLDSSQTLHEEIALDLKLETAGQVLLKIGRAADGHDFVPLSYDRSKGLLSFGDKTAELRLDLDNRLRVRLFIDGAVAEAFINEKVCISRPMALSEKSTGLSLVTTGGSARIERCRLWDMNSIWGK